MASPLVSVLIPCHNAEKYIGETLESVFRQTWTNLEVVVVDDGSADSSRDMVARFARGNLRLVSQENAGASAARNHAFRVSRGEFVQFLDADDIISPEKIELQVQRLAGNSRAVASAAWGRFYGSTDTTVFAPDPNWRDLDPIAWLTLSRAAGEGMLFPALWLVPRAVAEAAGQWDETLSLNDDEEYFTRVLLHADAVLFTAGARAYYRSGMTGSLSKSRHWSSRFRALELSEDHVRSRKDSEAIRRGFALSWQHLAHAAYPYDRELAERASARAKALHPVTIRPDGGPAFRIASRLVGWRAARRLQVASGRP